AVPPALAVSTVMLATADSTGAVVSLTTTENEATPTLPARSRAAQVTAVEPSGKTAPDWTLPAEVMQPSDPGRTPLRASWALTAKSTAAPEGPVASATTGLAGTITTGLVRSM